MNAHDIRKKREAEIGRTADREFAEHRVEVKLDVGLHRRWLCSSPNTGMYSFTIVTFPGRLVVAGDIGFLALERQDDMLAWARSSLRDLDYVAQKVPQCIQTREYDPDIAREWCRTELAKLKQDGGKPDGWVERIEVIKEVLEDWIDDEGRTMSELHEAGLFDSGDPPDFRNWTYNFLWCVSALRWFIKRLDAGNVTRE